jgi:subtilisin family serine protease/subtilisin-like proprotein convertase family protein
MWSTSRTSRLVSRVQSIAGARIASLLGNAGHAVEGLEPRQLLSALPANAELVPWGRDEVAAVRNSYIVTFDDAYSLPNGELMARDVANLAGATVREIAPIGNLGYYARLDLDRTLTREAARNIAETLPGVKWITPDSLKQSQRSPNDPRYNEQWTVSNGGQTIEGVPGTAGADIGAERAWDTTIGDRSVIIGVIDTGVDIDHPDLRNNIWVNGTELAGDGIDNDGNGYVDDVNGFDFADNDNDPRDTEGHGTAVAGVIGAVGNNGVGVTGVAWNTTLLPLKVADRFGALRTSAIIAAHDYVTELRRRGVNIIATNNSYGAYADAFYADNPDFINPERDAVQRFVNQGGLFVAAAGNAGVDNDIIGSFPSGYSLPNVIAVAATDNNDGLAGFSSFGAETVDLGAPGVSILTTGIGGSYQYINGTSFSSPTVAGAVALLKSAKPTATATEIKQALLDSVDPLPSLQGLVRTGGRLNVARAIDVILTDGPIVTSVTPGQVTSQINPATGLPFNTVTVTFSEEIAASIDGSLSAVSLRGDGADNTFGTSDDVIVPITGVARQTGNARTVVSTLSLGGLGGALPLDTYRLTLSNTAFRDLTGNRLNGNSSAGTDFVTTFRVINAGGANEQNDTLAQATNAGTFTATGAASFAGLAIGDGLAVVNGVRLDVDIFRVDITRPGQISAEVIAQRLPSGSSLDSVLRLFDANGAELAVNDQFFGQDSSLDFFVRNAGTYYVGVSGFGNARYNPRQQSSGASQSLGDYSLRINVNLAENEVTRYTDATNRQAGQGALPLTVPAGAPQVTSGTRTVGITVADTRQIVDINASVNLAHTATGDLEITLIGPDNTQVILFNQRGGTGDDLGTRNGSGVPLTYANFDDEASAAVSTQAAPFSGTFRAEQSLSSYDGKNANGTWFLRIRDLRPTDSGSIIDWNLTFTFATDVFGPFESNDTLTTAGVLSNTGTTFSTTRDAFIGDGGFGLLDRDIYQFTAQAGQTLSANVTPTSGTLNTILRIFDSAGNQVAIDNPTATRSASIANYVLGNSGLFYVAVSEGGNAGYNPTQVASGVRATTTGGYRLSVNLAPGVSDGGDGLSNLDGGRVDASVGQGGLFPLGSTAAGGATALRLDGEEFLSGNNAGHFFGLGVSGSSFSNSIASGTLTVQQPFVLTTQSDFGNQRLNAVSTFNGLRVQRSLSYRVNDSFIAVDVTLTNIGPSVLTGISWMEGINPNQGLSEGASSGATNNDVDPSGKLALASYSNSNFQNGLTVGLGAPSADTRAKATVLATNRVIRDPGVLTAESAVDPNGASGDNQIALSFSVGSLTQGASSNLRYFYFLGTSTAQVFDNASSTALYTQVNNGTGAGHLAANPSTPSNETLSDGTTQVPNLPFKIYYPEGFLGANINNFLPIINPNDQAARVVVVLRFEGTSASKRDRVAASFTLQPNVRAGVDINRVDTFAQNKFPDGSTIDPELLNKPYAIEIRSDRPVAAQFSYYDLVQIAAGPVAVGESFTSQVSNQWTFADVEMRRGATPINTFIPVYNPGDTEAKVTFRAYNTETGAVYTAPLTVAPKTRAGAALNQNFAAWIRVGDATQTRVALPSGTNGAAVRYGIFLDSDQPIVAAKTTFNPGAREATGTVGDATRGQTTGVIPTGNFGQRSTNETIGILNTNTTDATVQFSFLFENGTTDRRSLTVPANSHRTLRVQDLTNFPSGQAYSIFYDSNVAVAMGVTSSIRQATVTDAFSVTSSTLAHTWWGFGEGVRPRDGGGHPGLTENLRIYNPTGSDVTIEIKIIFDPNLPQGGGTEVFRRTVAGRRVTQFSIGDLVGSIGNRRFSDQSFGFTVQSPVPVVASMDHFDLVFPGGFATLGTPLGRTASIT